MTPGDALLWLALATGALSFVPRAWSRHAQRAHAVSVLAALALLVASFLAGSLSTEYVWAHVARADPWSYRLSGTWGGEEGTVLLWAAVVAAASLATGRLAGEPHRRATLALVAFSSALAGFALLFGAFDPTSAQQLAAAPQGRGLADVLRTPLMVVHPPVQFVAYGLLAVPAAYAIAGGASWSAHAFRWARLSWLFATLGLGLGALWAYYVLSFGGYWAWDPVETGNLLPWLALTAFLHAGKEHMRGHGHARASELLAVGAWLLTLFATFSTRSGLWVSVHAFTDPTDRFEPDAALRLLAITDVHLPTRAFLGLLGGAALALAALHLWRHAPRARLAAAPLLLAAGVAALDPAFFWGALFALGQGALGGALVFGALVAAPPVAAYLLEDEPKRRVGLDLRTLMTLAVALLAVSVAVALLLDLQVVNGPERTLFDQRAPFLALPIVGVLTLMLALASFGKRGALALAGAGLAGGALGWALVPDARVLALFAPPLAAAALAAVAKLAHVQGASAPRPLRAAGAMLLLSGILGIVLWSNPPTYALGRTLPDAWGPWLALAGLGLSALAILGGVAMFRARGRALALAGALAGMLAVGYGVGALLALAALALAARATFAGGPWLRHEAARVRETGVYLVHLAVVLGLLGYAASTYSQTREVHAAVPPDATLPLGERTLALGGADVTGTERIDAVHVPVALSSGGAESLDFRWRAHAGTYEGRLEVRRALAEDVYLTPLAFRTSEGWVGADSAAAGRVAMDDVDAVTFSAAVLPLMSFVWAGLWMSILGMLLILVGVRAVRAD